MLDMSQFKKVSEDEHNAVLRHPKGHSIKIAKEALSKKMKEQLSGLPLHKEEGGEISSAEESWQKAPQQAPQAPPPVVVINNGQQQPAPAPAMADMPPSIAPSQAPQQPDYFAQQATTATTTPTDRGPAATPKPTTQAKGDPSTALFDNYSRGLVGGINEQIKGAEKEAVAEGELGKSKASINALQAATSQDMLQKATDEYTAREKEIGSLREDIKNGHISPTQYLDNMSTAGKIKTAIGLLIGGIGQSYNGRENPVAKFLDQQIDRNIDAQKADLGKKNNLLGALLAQEKNLFGATEMFRAVQLDQYAVQLEEQTNRFADPIVKAKAQQKVGDLLKQKAEAMKNAATSRLMMGDGGGANSTESTLNFLRMFNPEKAKDLQSRYIPGVGVAQRPVPDAELNVIVARQDLDHKLGELENFVKQHGGSIDPEVVNRGKAMALDTQDAFRSAKGLGAFREGEAGFVNSIINEDPAKLFGNFRTLPGYKQIRKGNRDFLNQKIKGYGIHVPKIDFEAK